MPDQIDVVLPVRTKPVVEDTNRDISLIAHRRWYKTRLGIHKCLFGNREHRGAVKDPKTNFFIVFPTYKQAKMVAWDILKENSNSLKGKPNETDLTVTYPNGSKISLKGSDKPESLRGPGLDGLVLDEWAFHERPEVSTKILRPALADRKGWQLRVTTLDGDNHAWQDHLKAGSRYVFKASETGVISDDELEAMRRDMPEDEYRQEMECEPLSLSGAVFKEYDDEAMVVQPFLIPKSWNHITGLDWGISHNTVVAYCAVGLDGTLYIWDELVDNDKPVDYYAPKIKETMLGRDYMFPISPDTLKRDKFRNGIRYSVFQEFQEQGLIPVPANNQVSAGISKMKQLMLSGKFKVFENCTEIRAGLKRYKWKKNKDGRSEEVAKIKDDEVDAVRYAVATYFEASVASPEPEKQNTDQWFKTLVRSQQPRLSVGV